MQTRMNNLKSVRSIKFASVDCDSAYEKMQSMVKKGGFAPNAKHSNDQSNNNRKAVKFVVDLSESDNENEIE